MKARVYKRQFLKEASPAYDISPDMEKLYQALFKVAPQLIAKETNKGDDKEHLVPAFQNNRSAQVPFKSLNFLAVNRSTAFVTLLKGTAMWSLGHGITYLSFYTANKATFTLNYEEFDLRKLQVQGKRLILHFYFSNAPVQLIIQF